MTSTAHVRTAPVNWEDTTGAVVVGVDGTNGNGAALAWAVDESRATGRPLTLMSVLDDYSIPIHALRANGTHDWDVLQQIHTDVTAENPDLTVRRDVQVGGAVRALLGRLVEPGMLVVGKRARGAFGRLVVGSTSIGVAASSRVPVVVVPDNWHQADHAESPIVVGVDPRRPSPQGPALRLRRG